MSGYTPLGQPPGGIAWRSKIFKSFGLVVPPELGTTNAGYSTGQYGLAFTPSFSFVEAGTSVASVTLSVPPSLLQQAPKGQFGLSFAPVFRFAGAEHYTNSLALMVGPIHFQPSGVENYNKSWVLSVAPQFKPDGNVILNDIMRRPLKPSNKYVGPMAQRNAFRRPDIRTPVVNPAIYTDTFVRADSGSLGANWTNVVNGMSISSNKATLTSTAYCVAMYNTPMPADSMQVQVTWDAVWGAYLLLGMDSVGNGVILQAPNNGFEGSNLLINTTTGSNWTSATTRASVGVTWAANDVITFTRVGNVYTGYQNGIQRVTWTDTGGAVTMSARNRYVGLGGSASSGRPTFSNWSATQLV